MQSGTLLILSQYMGILGSVHSLCNELSSCRAGKDAMSRFISSTLRKVSSYNKMNRLLYWCKTKRVMVGRILEGERVSLIYKGQGKEERRFQCERVLGY